MRVKKNTKVISVATSPEFYDDINKVANHLNISVSDLIRTSVQKQLDNHETVKPMIVVGTRPDMSMIKTGSSKPDVYRLLKKKNGELVLQGMFTWNDGNNKFGYDWKDIPTEIET